MIRTLAAATLMAAAAAGMACADGMGEQDEVRIINDLPPANPGPGELIKRFPEEETNTEDSGRLFIEEEPVKKWGALIYSDAERRRIAFNANTEYTDEEGVTATGTMETILLVPQGVPVIDAASGMPVALSDIDASAPIYAWTSRIMTMSLPPQTAAQVVVVNAKEAEAVPSYVVVKELVTTDTDDGTVITVTDQDGNKWEASSEETEVTPYLTRNIVRLEDIKPGSRCMIWGETKASESAGIEQYNAKKIMLFAK